MRRSKRGRQRQREEHAEEIIRQWVLSEKVEATSGELRSTLG